MVCIASFEAMCKLQKERLWQSGAAVFSHNEQACGESWMQRAACFRWSLAIVPRVLVCGRYLSQRRSWLPHGG